MESPKSPNLREINRLLDRLEQSEKLTVKDKDNDISLDVSKNEDSTKQRDRSLQDTKRLIELLEKKQEESLKTIKELTAQTHEMTNVEEGENFRIQMWQNCLLELDNSSVTSYDELELFAGLSETDILDSLSDAPMPELPSESSMKSWDGEYTLRAEAKFHKKAFKAEFHSKGHYLITYSGKEFSVLDFETFKELQILQEIDHKKCAETISCVKLHSNADIFATVGSDGGIQLWALPSVKPVKKFWITSVPQSCSFSNDNLLAVGGSDGAVTVFDVSKLKQNETFQAHKSSVLCCIFSNEHFLTGSNDRSIRVWSLNANKRTLIHILQGHNDSVNIITVHPSSPSLLFSGSHDGNILVWSKFQHIKTLSKKHAAALETCHFHSDKNLLFSCSTDGKAFCWNLDTYESFEVSMEGKLCSFDPGGSELLVTSGLDGRLGLYSVPN